MSTRSTWWLVGSAVALFCFIYFFERHLGKQEAPSEAVRMLPGFTASRVTVVELISPRQTLRAERTNASWRLTSPVSYPGRSSFIEEFLSACSTLTARTAIDAQDLKSQPRGLSDYGLEPPVLTMRFQQLGQSYEVRMGSVVPVGNGRYAQVAGEEDVKVIDSRFFESMPRDASEWRDPALLNLEGLAYNRFELRAGTKGFEATRDPANRLWQITKPPPVKRADNTKINFVLREIQNWQATAFVDDPEQNLELLGLQPPQAELVIGQGTNDLVVLQFGASPTNHPNLVFARRMSHTNIVLADRHWLDALTQPYAYFRDQNLFSFEPKAITRIDFEGAGSFSVQMQTNGEWRVMNSTNLPADTGLVQQFITRIAGMKIAGFERDVVTDADLASFGLAPRPVQQITLLRAPTNGVAGATNVMVARLLIGTNLQADAVAARRADENSVYTLPLAQVQDFPHVPEELRSRRIWDFGTSNVTSVVASRRGNSWKILHEIGMEWRLDSASKGEIIPPAVDEMVFRLGRMTAEAWVERNPRRLDLYDLQQPAIRVDIELAGPDPRRTLSVHFGKGTPRQNVYAVTEVDGVQTVFEFPGNEYGALLQWLIPPAPNERR